MKKDLAERQAASSRYAEQNADVAEAYGVQASVEYVSLYAPAFIAEISREQIEELCEADEVESIDLWVEPVCDDTAEELPVGEAESAAAAVNTSYLDYMSASGVKHVLSGKGVIVGLLDATAIRRDRHSELYDSCIYPLEEQSNDPGKWPHPVNMARIICGEYGLAPECTLYSIGQGDGENFMHAVEMLISEGVVVINNSMSYSVGGDISRNGNVYTSVEKWLDHVAVNHSVTFVEAAGNIKRGTTGEITIAGLAYNVITVANYDYANNRIADNSCYDDLGGCRKPDVAAPGVNVLESSGTSPATACVTGMIALMMQAKPSLMQSPHIIKAIVIASCDRLAGSSSFGSGYDEKQGAGIVNAARAVTIISKNQYFGNYRSSDGSTRKKVGVMTVSSVHTYVLVGLKMNVATGKHTASEYIDTGMAALALGVTSTSGNTMGYCSMTNSSVQLVRSGASSNEVYLECIFDNVGNRGVPYAIAWY